jgi:hypothetical protein
LLEGTKHRQFFKGRDSMTVVTVGRANDSGPQSYVEGYPLE